MSWPRKPSLTMCIADIPAQPEIDERQRVSNLFALGTIPKAEFVIAEAVQRRREAREESMDRSEAAKEDVLLDLLVFLASKRERAALFSVV